MERLYNIPGIYNPDAEDYEFAAGTVGMLVSWINYPRWGIPDAEFMENIGAVPVPVWEDQATAPIPMGTSMLVLNKYSNEKDAAFEVIAEFFSSDHQGMLAAKYSEVPVLKDEEVLVKFGSESDKLQNIDMIPIFSVEYTQPPTVQSRWDPYVNIQGSLAEFAKLDQDIPTFLRILKEESEPKIKEAMALFE